MKTIKILLGLILIPAMLTGVSCGLFGGGEENEEAVLEEADALLEDLSDISLNLSTETLDEFDVPAADIEIPDIEPGSFNLDIDYDMTGELPSLSVPEAGGLPAPPPGFVPDESICAQFDMVPDCSFVPEQYRDLCEQCKNR